MANLRTISLTHPAILLLFAGAAGAAGCTSILGSFDFEGPPGSGGSTTSGTASTSGGGGTGTSSTSSTGSTCGSSAACNAPGDCLLQLAECTEATCDNGCCGTKPTPDGMPAGTTSQTPGDCQEVVCDGAGKTKAVVKTTDVPDDGKPCTKDACDTNGIPSNTAVAGTCSVGGKVCGDPAGAAAGKCVECNVNGDCTAPMVCSGNKCVSATCNDGQQNGNETDKDCGGSCAACGDGKLCVSHADCFSESCPSGTCVAATCLDGVQNEKALGETDVDCGGPNCDPCPTGDKCSGNGDCLSGKCVGMTCAPSCTDGVKNGGESDTDCGAVCGATKLCAFQKGCNTNNDCQTGYCNPGLGSCDTELLAANQAGGLQIAVDATNVYWVTYGDGSTNATVMKLALGGAGTPFPLQQAEPGCNGIAIDTPWPGNATFVYWTAGGGGGVIRRKRVDNSAAAETLATNQNIPGAGIAVNANAVYWANDGDGSVRRANLTSPFTVTPLATISQAFEQRLAIDTTSVYWTHPNSATIYKIGLTGGSAQPVVNGTPGTNKFIGLAVDATTLYWADSFAGRVVRMPIGGGTASNIGNGLTNPMEIAIDTNFVYVLEYSNNARLLAIPALGGNPKVLATGLQSPRGIAVDGTHVYFGAGGGLRRVHK